MVTPVNKNLSPLQADRQALPGPHRRRPSPRLTGHFTLAARSGCLIGQRCRTVTPGVVLPPRSWARFSMPGEGLSDAKTPLDCLTHRGGPTLGNNLRLGLTAPALPAPRTCEHLDAQHLGLGPQIGPDSKAGGTLEGHRPGRRSAVRCYNHSGSLRLNRRHGLAPTHSYAFKTGGRGRCLWTEK